MSVVYLELAVRISGVDIAEEAYADFLVGWIRTATEACLRGNNREGFKFRNEFESDIEVELETVAGSFSDALNQSTPYDDNERVKYRYFIFGGERYYAEGGAYGLLKSEPTIDRAKSCCESLIGKEAVTEKFSNDPYDATTHIIEWAHVLDTHTGEIVFSCGVKPYGTNVCPFEIRDKVEFSG